jgi:hypothetical protein
VRLSGKRPSRRDPQLQSRTPMSTSLLSATNSTIAHSHDEIAQCARELWTNAGQPESRDDEFWLEAEHRMILARQKPALAEVTLATLPQPVTSPNKAGRHPTPPKIRRGR